MGTKGGRQPGEATASLARAIREVQGARRMSVRALSDASGVPYGTLRKIMSGDQPIDFEELTKLARALRVSTSSLAERSESDL